MISTRNKGKLVSNNEKRSQLPNNVWKPGVIVWAQFNKKYWPAVVIDHQDVDFKAPKPNKSWVLWFGDYRISEVENKHITLFEASFNKIFKENWEKKSVNWGKGVLEAIKEFGFPDKAYLSIEQLIEWAKDGFTGHTNNNCSLSPFVNDKLVKLRNKNKKDDGKLKKKIGATATQKAIIKAIVNGSKSLRSICLGCYSTDVCDDHPLLNGFICADCKIKVKNTFYVIGDDGIKYFCTICACPGNMIVCDKDSCGRAYCSVCIDDLAKSGARFDILNTDPWHCFTCSKENKLNGLIELREDWKEKLKNLFTNVSDPMVPPPAILEEKRPIRVLSTFDGIGTGLLALEKLNIVVDSYFSCEIDMESMNVVRKNFPNRVVYLGDIKKLSESDIKKIAPIDLFIGGSPCNDFSQANPNRKGLYDHEGSGVLFFDFFRILFTLRIHNGKPFFWLYENVASMPLHTKLEISRFFQCEPTLIDSGWVSPQYRRRLFWGNLPTLQDQMFEDDGPGLQKYLKPGRKATVSKVRTVTTRNNSLRQGPSMTYPVINYEKMGDDLDIVELEEIFGYPQNYTNVGGLSKAQRQVLLGKAWSVQVICLLFRVLKEHFQNKIKLENNLVGSG